MPVRFLTLWRVVTKWVLEVIIELEIWRETYPAWKEKEGECEALVPTGYLIAHLPLSFDDKTTLSFDS